VPNLISALRLPLAAAFLVADTVLGRGALLFLGALTDLLDGWLARKLKVESRAGALLDPLFDKLFVLIALAAFLPGPYLDWRDFAILISRGLYMAFGFLVAEMIGVDVQARSRPGGKLVTVLQMVTLFVLLLAPDQAGLFVVFVGVASIIAITDYTLAGIASLRERRSVTTKGR
jgi:CDP-diacylglycerol--glycerol-3-phosphate 3-phosphatidyltransferase